MKDCTLYKTVDIIGKRWTLCILLELYKGQNSEKQFNELKNMLQSITPKTLATRLRELEEQGMIKKDIDNSTVPIKCKYSLTESGEDFVEIIQQIKGWGLKWKFENDECKSSNCKFCGINYID
ncbi:MAG: winged helix-turn-helix transcriptional regulator [Methanohalobium sp.]|uniref:winged helix-turn-helix transcriptional regulator n=1 Tax=Methanohalobium sp. TaxID=2837493 RepID=UPI00397BDA9A